MYDANKKVSRVVYSDGALEEYSYKGDTTKIIRTEAGVFEFRKVITNNASGMATLVRMEDNIAGTSGSVVTYLYNGTELIQEIQKPIGSATTTVTNYNWAAGNPIETKRGAGITLLDYYTNKQSQPGNYLEAVNVIQGYSIFKTKNLVKTVSTDGNVVNLKYVFDADDNISSVEFTGTDSSALHFTYQCE